MQTSNLIYNCTYSFQCLKGIFEYPSENQINPLSNLLVSSIQLIKQTKRKASVSFNDDENSSFMRNGIILLSDTTNKSKNIFVFRKGYSFINLNNLRYPNLDTKYLMNKAIINADIHLTILSFILLWQRYLPLRIKNSSVWK